MYGILFTLVTVGEAPPLVWIPEDRLDGAATDEDSVEDDASSESHCAWEDRKCINAFNIIQHIKCANCLPSMTILSTSSVQDLSMSLNWNKWRVHAQFLALQMYPSLRIWSVPIEQGKVEITKCNKLQYDYSISIGKHTFGEETVIIILPDEKRRILEPHISTGFNLKQIDHKWKKWNKQSKAYCSMAGISFATVGSAFCSVTIGTLADLVIRSPWKPSSWDETSLLIFVGYALAWKIHNLSETKRYLAQFHYNRKWLKWIAKKDSDIRHSGV